MSHVDPRVAAMATALPSASALELKGVVEIEWDGNAEVHGHVLNILSPVCGMSSQLLHLKEKTQKYLLLSWKFFQCKNTGFSFKVLCRGNQT